MDRSLAMLLMLGLLVMTILLFLALFAVAPVFWSCMASLLYTLSVFLFNESHNVHNAQEFENRFWTIFAILFSTALFFAKDSPLALGVWSPSFGFLSVVISAYAMHFWDRSMHRNEMGKIVRLKKGTATTSLNRLQAEGIPVQNLLEKVNSCLAGLDQIYIPSTINNLFDKPSVIRKEKEIISIFQEAEPKVLNYLICNSRLGLIFYKVKDHRSFNHKHRTKLIELLAIEKISQLTVYSKVIVLHALQTMKLPANVRAEYCVQNIIMNTKQDELSELKTFMDAKGDYWCMNKLIYDDIKSDLVRNDILEHIQRQARVQFNHVAFNTRRAKDRKRKFWRKVLSDVDDTLTCSGGSYPAGIDKRYGKKVVYPGVLGFYRELDLGVNGPEEWPSHTVGNLVFLSARPHVFKDVSEKVNFAKFEKLQLRGMHTIPSLLAGDIRSGVDTIVKNDFEPLARKKFENFQQYVSIYPEFRHVFVCDNGQGDVRAAELMFEAFPKQLEAVYVQEVQEISKTYKYNPEFWKTKAVKPFFFKTYTDAALHAATRNPPLIRISGLRRICIDAMKDFYMIQTKQWPSQKHKWDRHDEINQSLHRCNKVLSSNDEYTVPLLEAERLWKDGEKVNTPFGRGEIKSFDRFFDLYEVELDWRPLNVQAEDYEEMQKLALRKLSLHDSLPSKSEDGLPTVFEADEEMSQAKSLKPDSFDSQPENQESSSNKEYCNDITTKTNGNSIPDTANLPMDDDNNAAQAEKSQNHKVIAKIKCRLISKYSPPSLPILANESQSTFSFWGSRTESAKPKAKALFNKDDKCSTPYGCGTVIEYREKSGIVVLAMSGWYATSYLNVESVNIVSEGFFNRMLRMISTEPKMSSQKKEQKETQFPYAMDTIMYTPFGEGRVIRPLKRKVTDVVATEKRKILNSSLRQNEIETIAISLSSWSLADASNPVLYCTGQTAQSWKAMDDQEDRSKNSGGIFSAFGSIVSQSMKLIARKPKRKSTVPSEIVVPMFERFYSDGASVVTPFGNGKVHKFRVSDGMYTVILETWKMADNTCPKIFLMKESLSYQIAPGCVEGHPVLTTFGISGTLVSVQPKTGVHIIAAPMTGMVCYLQPKDVLRALKACVNEDVLTPFGNGKVIRFRPKDDIYEIELAWGAKLFSRAESFDRDHIGCEDQGGFHWVFKLFFNSDGNSIKGAEGSERSRSNSITSARTLSSRSIL